MNDRLSPRLRTSAVALVRQALGSAAKVDAAARASGDYDVEVHRKGMKPIRFRFRTLDGDAGNASEEVLIVASATRADVRRLRARDRNFVALNGSIRLVIDWLLLDRTDLDPAPLASVPRRVNPFADRNSLIPRTLLSQPERVWGVRELAHESGVALGTASQVVRALTDMRAVRVDQQGKFAQVRLDDPDRLLRRWMSAYTWERNQRVAFNAPMGDPARFLRRLPGHLAGLRWALTLQAGASLVAPHAMWDRVHAYVDVPTPGDLLAIAGEHGWTPAEDGRLVLMKPYYRDSVWHGAELVGDLPVVSELQLVLDLWDYPLRGREQAEHLLATHDLRT